MRKAAIAIGRNADTVMKHYAKLDEQQATDEVMRQLAERLGAKSKKTSGPLPADGGEGGTDRLPDARAG